MRFIGWVILMQKSGYFQWNTTTWTALFSLLGILAAIVLGVSVALKVKQLQEKQTATPARKAFDLFDRLCQVHALDRSDQATLEAMAELCKLRNRAELFVRLSLYEQVRKQLDREDPGTTSLTPTVVDNLEYRLFGNLAEEDTHEPNQSTALS